LHGDDLVGISLQSLASENWSPWLSYSVVFVIVRLADLVQCLVVTDRRMDRRTLRQTRDDSIYRASIASSGKEELECLFLFMW